MARIGRGFPAQSYVFINEPLTEAVPEHLDVFPDPALATAVANDATVQIKPSAGTVTAAAAVQDPDTILTVNAGTVAATTVVNDPDPDIKPSAGTVAATVTVDTVASTTHTVNSGTVSA